MINDITKPLVLVGSNYNIFKLYELATSIGYTVAGIIDDDYHGQGNFKNIPIIARENDIASLKESHQFICATNWIPGQDSQTLRNKEKRLRLIALLDSLNIAQASLISNQSQVSSQSFIGNGVVIDAFAMIEPEVVIGNYTTVSAYSVIGHNSVIGTNNMIQRYCLITSAVTTEENVYLGLCSRVCRSNVLIKQGTFLHPNLMLLRGTQENEEVSLIGKDLRKVYQPVEIN